MPDSAEFRLSDDLALVADGRGRFRWEPEPPGLYPVPPMTMGPLKPPDDDVVCLPFRITPPTIRYHRLTRALLRDLGEFCLTHAPWSRRWLRDLDTLTCLAAELTGYPVDYRSGRGPYHFWPLVLAACLTRQFLADISPSEAVSELYPESNIAFDTVAARATDPRELTEHLLGTYSRPLAEAVRQAFIAHGPEVFPVISLARGLEADVVAGLLPGMAVTPTMQMRGVPAAPDWLLDMPVPRRVRWTRQVSVLCEVLRLTEGSVPTEQVLSAHDAEAAHEVLLAGQLASGKVEMDITEYRHPAAVDLVVCTAGRTVSLKPLVRPVDLYMLGHRMHICIGLPNYLHRLAEGESVFFTDDPAAPTVAAEFAPDGRLIEAVGPDNAPLDAGLHAALSSALIENR